MRLTPLLSTISTWITEASSGSHLNGRDYRIHWGALSGNLQVHELARRACDSMLLLGIHGGIGPTD